MGLRERDAKSTELQCIVAIRHPWPGEGSLGSQSFIERSRVEWLV